MYRAKSQTVGVKKKKIVNKVWVTSLLMTITNTLLNRIYTIYDFKLCI